MMFVPDEIWVTANFKETQLDKMRPGQPVTLRIDAYRERTVLGRVASELLLYSVLRWWSRQSSDRRWAAGSPTIFRGTNAFTSTDPLALCRWCSSSPS
jgi:hypothetical protein